MEEIKVALGITKNIGNYESLRIDAEYSASLVDGADLDEAYVRAWGIVDSQVESKLLELSEETDRK